MPFDIFLDRDGTLIKDTGYISKASEIEILDGVYQGLKLFVEKGYRLHIVSNQSGVKRGNISIAEFKEIECKLDEMFRSECIIFESHNYCFHLPTDDCLCRKPKAGLLEKVADNYEIDKFNSAMIGDKESDLLAAKSFGVAFWKVELTIKFDKVAREVVEYFERL